MCSSRTEAPLRSSTTCASSAASSANQWQAYGKRWQAMASDGSRSKSVTIRWRREWVLGGAIDLSVWVKAALEREEGGHHEWQDDLQVVRQLA